MYVDVLLACTYVHHMHFWFPWKLEEGIGELELELWMIVNYVWMVGIEHRSSTGASVLNHQTFLPSPLIFLFLAKLWTQYSCHRMV